MKKIILSSLILGVMLATTGIVVAKKSNVEQQPANIQFAKEQGKKLGLLENAEKVAPGIFYLGESVDKGKVVEGYAFTIRNKKEFVKPGTICGDNVCDPGENKRKCPADCGGEDPEDPDTSSCYGFLAKGAKWRTIEDYIVDPNNIRGLISADVKNILSSSITKWETVAGANILGDEDITKTVNRNTIGSLNGENEVMFRNIEDDGAIAVAIVWGIFGGPPFARELVEWDMIFDDADFDWGTGELNKMDFENIATHELGHAVGLGDLYNSECSEQTMYGYSTEGETKKRTLESGDIAGLNLLY